MAKKLKVAGTFSGTGEISGAVLSVNGISPDENGNVEITIPDSGDNAVRGIWGGKKFTAFGTSITYLCRNYGGGYLEIIKSRNGFDSYRNSGVSGAAMANNTANGNGINHKIRNTDISDSDLVVIECCTNDFKLNVSIGTVGQMGDSEFDTTTFCGALRDSIEYILTTNPTKHILLITDPQRDNEDYDVNYTNSTGHKLIDYVDALHSIAELYGLPVCDWYRTSGINARTLDTYTVDGLHPNALGYIVLGNIAASAVENMYCGYSDVGLYTLEPVEPEYEYGFIVKATGELKTTGQLNSYWKTSAYIPVSAGDILRYTGTVQPTTQATTGAAVWGYSDNKTPVQVIIDNGHYIDGRDFVVPNGVGYIRACFYDNGEYPVSLAKAVW